MATVTQKFNVLTGKWITLPGVGPMSGVRVVYVGSGLVPLPGGGLVAGVVNLFRTITVQSAQPLAMLNTSNISPAMAVSPNLTVTFTTWGSTIPYLIGSCRVMGQMIWAQGIVTSGSPLDGGTLTFAVGFGYNLDPDEVWTIGRITMSGKEVYNPTDGWKLNGGSFTSYPGSEDQLPDPLIAADKTDARTPGFRGLRYIVFNQVPLDELGRSTPQVTCEFIRATRVDVCTDDKSIFGLIAGLGGITFASSGIDDQTDGSVFSSDIVPQQFFRDNRAVYNYTIKDGDPVTFVRRPIGGSLTIDRVYDRSDLVPFNPDDPDDPLVQFGRKEPTEVVNQQELQYCDIALNYTNSTQYGRKPHFPIPITNSSLVSNIQLQLEHTAGEVLLLSYGMLYRDQTEQECSFNVRDHDVEVGDVLQLNMGAQGEFIVRVIQQTLRFDAMRRNEIIAVILQTVFGLTAATDTGDATTVVSVIPLVARNWVSVNGSSDLHTVIAAANADYLYRSATTAVGFTPSVSADKRAWTDTACSADGGRQYACASDGVFWYSSDFGKSFNPGPLIASFTGVCCDPTGLVGIVGMNYPGPGVVAPAIAQFVAGFTVVPTMVASLTLTLDGDQNEKVAGVAFASITGVAMVLVRSDTATRLYIGDNPSDLDSYGTAIDLQGAGITAVLDVACSGDTSRIVVTTFADIFLSTDTGGTWTSILDRVNFDGPAWAAMSPDGAHILVGGNGVHAYYSHDSGATFTQATAVDGGGTFNKNGAISDDGTTMVVASGTDYVFHSIDSGVTFTVQQF